MMPSLSVIIITRNEAHNIRDCLASVAFADEVVVVDSGSSDDTVAICQAAGARVYCHDWPGFGIQKNRALDYASGDWVVSLDADERVTPELQAAIQAVIDNPAAEFDSYRISRLSSYCGRFMRHSGWYPDLIVRLFKRGKARFSDNLVHESLQVHGPTGLLAGELLHYSFENLEQVLDKVDRYSTASAQMLYQRGKRASLRKAVVHALWGFFRCYVLRAGFLDGREGFMLAVSNAEGTYYRYVKLMLLQRKS